MLCVRFDVDEQLVFAKSNQDSILSPRNNTQRYMPRGVEQSSGTVRGGYQKAKKDPITNDKKVCVCEQ